MANVNGFQGVPWMVGGGAEHTPDLGRAIAHAASQGGEGVVLPTDLKVTPRSPAGTGVDIAPGQAFIRQRAANVAAQSYLGYAPGPSSVDGPAVSASVRSYLIIVHIKDPQYGYPAYPTSSPSQIKGGPYVYPELYGPVPGNTTRASQIPALADKAVYALARIDIPANTTTITAAMIDDLRKLARGRTELFLDSADRAGRPNLNVSPTEAPNGAWTAFPEYAPAVLVPDWATDFRQSVLVTSVRQFNATTKGHIRALLGDIGGAASEINLVAANGTAHAMLATNGGSCVEHRGTHLAARSEARITEGGIFATSGVQIQQTVHFYEKIR